MQFWPVSINRIQIALLVLGTVSFSAALAAGENGEPVTATEVPLQTATQPNVGRSNDTTPKSGLIKSLQNKSKEPNKKTDISPQQAVNSGQNLAVKAPLILPKVAVRLSTHQTYVRIVFDWDAPTSYSISEYNGIARLEFSRPGKIDLSEVYKRLPKSVGVFESDNLNGVLQTAFTIPKNVRLRDSMIGHLVVVDILTSPDQPAVHPPGRLLTPAPLNAPTNPALSAQYAPANIPPPGDASIENGASKNQNPNNPDSVTKSLRSTPENYDLVPEIAPLVNCSVTRDPVPSLPWRFNCSSPVGAALFQRESSLYVVFDHKINFDLSKAAITPVVNNEPTNPKLSKKPGEAKNDSSIGYPGKSGKQPGNIGFPEKGGIANSDQAASVTGSSNSASGALNVSEFEVLVVANGSAVRLAMPPVPTTLPNVTNPKASVTAKKWVGRIAKLNPSIDPNRPNIAKNGMAGSVWVVGMALAEQSSSIAPDFPIENVADANLKGRNYLRIPLADATQIIPIRFSEYDRPLLVIPTKQAGRGVGHIRKFMQFTLLPSQQGLLVQLESDGINIGINQGAVIIGGEVPVLLSRQLPPAKSVFDFSRWQNLGEKYDEVRQRLQHVAAQSDASERDAARFDLAQFFLTYQHAADAIGWLDLLQAKKDDEIESPLPLAQQSPSLIALRGAAMMLNGNAKQALRDLSDARLDGIPQIGLWRGGALAASEQWAAADAAFRAGGNVPPTSWPLYVRSELILKAADAAWHLGNKERVKTLLLDYPSGQSEPNYAYRVNYLRAQLRLATGDLFDEKIAIGFLDDMIANGDAWARAHGTWLRLQIDLKHDAIPIDQAVVKLEHLRYAWAGGEMEYEILKQLGDLYFKLGKPREGLKSMREAATWFPNRHDHPSLRAHLIDRFVELYTDPDLSYVPTLAALAVYDENRDLTPRDARGDAMIQQLAQRLVKIDLLDRAAELLDYQIRVRLSGVEKSRVGANLAEIQLLDNKPDRALTALNNSENSENPPQVVYYRSRLRAKALFKSNRSKEALQILTNLTDKDSDLLRAEIFVATQQWSQAAQAFSKLVGAINRNDTKPMDENRQNYIVNLAAALVMAGENAAVQKLNTDFAPIFPDGLQKQAFILLTSGNNNKNGADLPALMAKFSDLQQFRASMEAFTNSRNGGKPSDASPTNGKTGKNDAQTGNTTLAKKP